MAGTPLRNLEVFEKICGPKACSRVVMMTTMWDELDDEETGESRQEELETTFWKPMIDRGSKTERYRNTSESAWRILEPFLGNQRQRLAALQPQKGTVPQQKQKVAIRLQHETVQQQKALSSTDAGQALYEKIETLDKQRKSLMRTLEKQMNKRGTDKEIVDLLRQQYDGLEKEREAALGELHKLKIPVPQRLLKSVGMKKRYRK
jgi:predicted ribosome quality control (RQC) complex YloA/Tae2 family protein